MTMTAPSAFALLEATIDSIDTAFAKSAQTYTALVQACPVRIDTL